MRQQATDLKLLEDIWNPETKTLLVYHAQLNKTFVRKLKDLNKIRSWFVVKGKSTFQYEFANASSDNLIKILSSDRIYGRASSSSLNKFFFLGDKVSFSADDIELAAAMVESHSLIKTHLC